MENFVAVVKLWTWEVSLPAEIPPELPEPTPGINYVRDDMQQKDWLSFVAAHSDAWLYAVSYYFAARFGFDQLKRKHLFNKINDIPSILESITGTATEQAKEKKSTTNHSNSKSKSNSKVWGGGGGISVKYSRAVRQMEEVEVAKRVDEEAAEENDNTLCEACGKNYGAGEFWICCDVCEKWFHGKCVKITLAKAEHIKQYSCPSCRKRKRTRYT
ncbi:hypothetical protein SAY87_019172 [Trapa incisa]|uniref:PHD finger protein ALFIN-LIKE n=1 Tax=Trapa incisa TaxID=236973 RepID=A0AAN7K147_9MYRT|nr:hypothetical protein SAY87_019172 [Trapa incisa]